MQACSTACGLKAPAPSAAKPARLARRAAAPRPARRTLAPVAVLDPSAAEAFYQVQEFGLTIMGVGIVSAFAAGMAHSLRGAAARYTTTTAAAAVAEAPAAAAAAAPAPALEQMAAAPVQQAAPVAAAAALEISDIKSQLQEAAAAAVAAVKSAADAEAAPAAAKPAAATAAAPNGAAVQPGLTVEEATKQVKDWIAAWNSGSEGSEGRPTELEFPAPSAAPTTRVTEPSLPSSAAALLSAMTADAPVGATPRGEEGPAAGSPSVEEQVLSAVAAAAPTSEPSGDASAAEKEAEYKARISAVMADAKQQQAAKAERVAERMRKRVVEVGVGYQAKIESLWQGYESKKEQEAALLAKSEAILAGLAEREAEERRVQESVAELEATRKREVAAVEQGVLATLFARIVAAFQALQRWVQQLLSSLTGGGSGSGSAAGASA